MPNFDDMKLAVEALSGGKNTVLLDDREMPSVMVLFPRFNISDVITGASQNIHPGFSVNGAEKDMYISKFQNIVMNDRAYSLPLKDPKTSVNFDSANTYCRNKGTGWGLMPYSLWSALALWCRKNGTMPRGNNNYGKDHGYPHEKGMPTFYNSDGTVGRCATGSGPDTWNHNWLPDGIADLNGNVWEWCAGMRLQAGEIQIIPYANSMMAEISMAAGSTEWKAISSDGTLVTPGTSGTLKWDWVSSKVQLTNGDVTYTTDQGNGGQYNAMTLASGLTEAPELAKALLLYPDEPGGDYGGDYHYLNTVGERLPGCGGIWGHTSYAGVFGVSLSYPRSNAFSYFGFRSAFCEL